MKPTNVNEILVAKRGQWFKDVRFVGNINGCYVLSSRREGSGVQVFACRSQSVSPVQVVITAPVAGGEGERVTLHFPELGILKGKITHRVDRGFAVELVASDEERAKLGARIDWLKLRSTNAASDKREHKRTLPRNPMSRLTLAGGRSMECFIIDLSRSGAAISADIHPGIGMMVAIGRVVGRVVRHLEVGFAVQFSSLQDPDTIESALGARPAEMTAIQG